MAESVDYISVPEPHLSHGPRYTRHDRSQMEKAPTGYHYVYIHNISHHYGHFLIGALSRLWSLPLVQRSRLRLVFNEQSSLDAVFDRDFLRATWGALGLSRENFACFPEGAIFDEIDVPGASFEQNSHVHQVYAEVMQYIGDRLCPYAPPLQDKPTYLTKQNLSSGIWRMRDEHILTEKLSGMGFDILAPETLSLQQQIGLWRSKRIFVATTGSSLHTAAFAPGSRLLCINNVPEIWSNQILIDRACNNRGRYVHDRQNFDYVCSDGPFSGELIVHDMDALAAELYRMTTEMRE